MILTTTNSIEGHEISEYKGIVTGVALNEEKLTLGFSVSKYYKAVEESIDTVKENAFQRMVENAEKMNADAVVGIKVEIELTTSNYAMASVTGTAVTLS